MSEPIGSRWINPPPDGKRFMLAFGAAVLLELAASVLLLPVMARPEAPSDTPSVVKLSIVVPAPAPRPPPAPKPVPVPVKPVPPPPLPPAPPLPIAPPMPPPPPVTRQLTHLFRHHVEPHVSRRTVPAMSAPAMPSPPQSERPVAPQAPTGGEVDAFSAAIKRALQAHANAVYPAQAQMAHETGAPVLTFTYLNGAVSNIQLAKSCGFPLLDQAALEDARIATYPPAPPAFAGRTEYVTVAVSFQLAAPGADDD